MPAVYIYECAACDARFSLLGPEPPAPTQTCIHCFAKGAHLVCRGGEQEGPLHRFPSETKYWMALLLSARGRQRDGDSNDLPNAARRTESPIWLTADLGGVASR
jgi:hypothetical protein